MDRRWIPVIVFWALFLSSVALYQRVAWLDAAWYFGLLLVLITFSIYSIVHIIRNRNEKPTGSYPRWFKRFAMDEPEDRTGTGLKTEN